MQLREVGTVGMLYPRAHGVADDKAGVTFCGKMLGGMRNYVYTEDPVMCERCLQSPEMVPAVAGHTYTAATDEDKRSLLGEGFHTGMRKVGDSAASTAAWKAISAMDNAEWGAILKFVIDGMEYMGFQIVKVEKP